MAPSNRRDVLGDLYDLTTQVLKERQAATDITFFKNAGGGHLDLVTCEAISSGKGWFSIPTKVPIDFWFCGTKEERKAQTAAVGVLQTRCARSTLPD